MRSAFGKYYTNINSVHMWRVTFKETGCIVLGIKSRMLNFSVFQRNVFKLNLLLEMKYSGEKKNKEKQKNEGSAPGLSLLSSKTIFAKLNISSTSCGLMLLMTESFLFYTSGSLSDCVFFFFFLTLSLTDVS